MALAALRTTRWPLDAEPPRERCTQGSPLPGRPAALPVRRARRSVAGVGVAPGWRRLGPRGARCLARHVRCRRPGDRARRDREERGRRPRRCAVRRGIPDPHLVYGDADRGPGAGAPARPCRGRVGRRRRRCSAGIRHWFAWPGAALGAFWLLDRRQAWAAIAVDDPLGAHATDQSAVHPTGRQSPARPTALLTGFGSSVPGHLGERSRARG